MKIDFTTRRFPVNGHLKEKCGLPFSTVIQPFSDMDVPEAVKQQAPPLLDDVVRCHQCHAYINCYCNFSAASWSCSLCGRANKFKSYMQSRYQVAPEKLCKLPEAAALAYEAVVGEPVRIHVDQKGVSGPAPVYLALVDVGSSGLGGGPEFIELVRSALEAALEALPPCALFGLITFSDKLALHDLRSSSPTSRLLPLHGPLKLPDIPLKEVMPLRAFLTPVSQFKDRIATSLETLILDGKAAEDLSTEPGVVPATRTSEATQVSASIAPTPAGGMSRDSGLAGPAPCRALGPALLAVLDYLQALKQPPFLTQTTNSGDASSSGRGMAANAQAMADLIPPATSPVHLMLFLSGPPDLGPGRVLDPALTHSGKLVSGAEGQVITLGVEQAGHVQEQKQPCSPQPKELTPHSKKGEHSTKQQAQNKDQALTTLTTQSKVFYEGAAVAAASLGVCMDVFAVNPGMVGLSVLEPLCHKTGGGMYLYASAEESALPQDVYRRLSCQRASSGLLRLRTSAGFKPVRYYGRMFPDRQYDSLHHIIACDSSDTFAVDFEHTSKLGFADPEVVLHPTVQYAFQYTTVELASASRTDGIASHSVKDEEASLQGTRMNGHQNNGDGHSSVERSNVIGGGALTDPRQESIIIEKQQQWVLQRRLRVVTLRVSVTRDPIEVYKHCSTDAVLSLLLHKVCRLTEGAVASPSSLSPSHPTSSPSPQGSRTPAVSGGPSSGPSGSSSTAAGGTGSSGSSSQQASSSASPPHVTAAMSHARMLLRDWLVLLSVGYERAIRPKASPKEMSNITPDLDFSEVPALKQVPRLVFALLRSPLLVPPEPSIDESYNPSSQQHPDLGMFIRHLWTCLPPHDLRTAVYPELSAWSGPDEKVGNNLPLSASSLWNPIIPTSNTNSGTNNEAGAPASSSFSNPSASKATASGTAALLSKAVNLLLVDAYIIVMILYKRPNSGLSKQQQQQQMNLPFPPPQGSAIAKAVSAIRQNRRICPKVRYVREGSEEAELFSQLLLDEPDDHIHAESSVEHKAANMSLVDASASSATAAAGDVAPVINPNSDGTGSFSNKDPQSYGLTQFVDHVRGEVLIHLASGLSD
ncbi:hypothetical protein CEUSTIGMA_g12047.t1 [Chlamydomonas eustigma]|uniref:Protein transport protein SEC23 n=1 Tax=Chlamydomonas eustigma TaxID=1157962 RepID=A0A250XNM8_9CHLO|nr:hypothetical protein CEUSTIGMA_g12047.t1 [Chlamydomonas eustigma]|eukprot:GAX84626.1 hypothetical protein CEUSTIGMA_g12047.t1 [Chlamydomonas eustigma]